MNISQLFKATVRTLDRNSPVILTGVAVAGVITTAVLAVRVTPQALRRIEEAETSENGVYEITGDYDGEALVSINAGSTELRLGDRVKLIDQRTRLTRLEKFRLVWPLYLPAAGVGVASIAAVIGAQSINSRRQAVLVSGIAVAERALTEYQDKVIELDEGKTDTKVRDSIMEDHVKANPPTAHDLVIPQGDVLCYDDSFGRYFWSTKEKIQQAKIELNEAMINGDMYCSLNDFYALIDLAPTKMGELLGWSTENMVDINFTSMLVPNQGDGGIPCLAIGFRALPLQDYYKFR